MNRHPELPVNLPSSHEHGKDQRVESVIHVLHLEDDPVDSQLVQGLLEEVGLKVEIERVHSLPDFERALPRPDLKLILSDYTVPGTNVLDALRLAHSRRPDIPYIFVSGTIGEDLAIECLRRGATDYVLKTGLSRLGPAVRRALQEAEEQARRKQGEQELARTTARFNAIISSAMDAIISIDERQNILLFNPAAEKMFGVRAETAIGQPIARFIPARFRTAHTRDVNEFGKTGVSSRAMGHLGSVRGLRASGEEFPIEASISQVQIQDEKLYTVILRDITDRMRSEEALKRARDELAAANTELERKVEQRTAQLRDANTNLQNFAYTAAHDLRAPLRAIRNFSAILLEDYGHELSADPKSLLDRVTEAADQMKNLLDDLLEYSKVTAEEIQLEAVDLSTAVREAAKLLDQDIRARQTQLSVEEPLPAVVGHHSTLVLLVQNFLSNAVKFVPPERVPNVRVRAEIRRPSLPSERRGPEQSSFVRLWVEDNGIGIAPEDLDKIFGVFRRLHSKQEFAGTGLGLAISRKAAERMGGRVGVESTPGQGSRFWIELPRFVE